jgi:hypothetical protein
MKNLKIHKILSIVCCFVLALTSLTFAGCVTGENDTLFVNVERNSNKSSWAGSWLKKYGSKECSLIINRYEYSTAEENLPTASDMTAPSGKVFAGWYFDSSCTNGNSYNLYNWEQKTIKTGTPTSVSAYANWIDDTNVDVILNLDNNEANFLDTGANSKTISFAKSDTSTIFDNLPTNDTNEVSLNHATLVGWSLHPSYYQYSRGTITQETITTELDGSAYINLYAVWEYDERFVRLDFDVQTDDGVSATIILDHFISYKTLFDYTEPYAPRVLQFSKKSEPFLACYYFADDDLTLYQSYIPTIDDIKVTNSNGKNITSQYQIAGYKIEEWGVVSEWTDDYIASHCAADSSSGAKSFQVHIMLEKK